MTLEELKNDFSQRLSAMTVEERLAGLEKAGFIFPDRTTPLDWTEDFGLENGRYYCGCVHCGKQFQGYKRRVVCKECHDSRTPK